MTPKKGLGKGLGALIANNVPEHVKVSEVLEIDINKIEPNPDQPRKNFEDDSLKELSESIVLHGVIQPLIVKDEGEYYMIIAGERRWRASRMAQLRTVPCIVRDYSDIQTLEVALIENIQREDLNPIEEALCYKRLVDEFSLSQEAIAGKVGKNRSHISNSMRLLGLDERVLAFVRSGGLSAGHGRALLGLYSSKYQYDFAMQVLDEGLSVREIEEIVRSFNEKKPSDKEKKKPTSSDSKYNHFEQDLKTILGTKVSIRDGRNKGRIEIEYYSPEELDRLLVFLRSKV